MAGENFCAESLERRRKDVALGRSIIDDQLVLACAAAESADMSAVHRWLDRVLVEITKLRNDLDDLALERERQMDAEDELCGR